MNNETRLISFLAALGVAAGLYGLLDRPAEGNAPNVAPSQTPPVVQSEPAVAAPPPLTPPAAKPPAIARLPKQVPATENHPPVAKGLSSPPEPTPVAALGSNAGQSPSAPSQNPAAEKPNSVSGWGPWSGPQPGATTGGPTSSPDGTPSVLGQNPTVNAAAGTPPPPAVVPPPASSPPGTNPPGTSSSIRPGYGWGDKNHIHIPRRDK